MTAALGQSQGLSSSSSAAFLSYTNQHTKCSIKEGGTCSSAGCFMGKVDAHRSSAMSCLPDKSTDFKGDIGALWDGQIVTV